MANGAAVLEVIQQRRSGRRRRKSVEAIVNASRAAAHSRWYGRALLMMHVPLCKTIKHETRDAFVRAATGPHRRGATQALQKLMDDLPPIHKQLLGGWPIIWRASSDGKD